jgi:hypothetical protein
LLAGDWAYSLEKNCSVDTSLLLRLLASFLTHEHPIVSLMLSSDSTHPTMARDASPVMTHAAAPPCTAAASFPSSLGHAVGTVGFGRGWGSHRSSWLGRRPRRRRGRVGQRHPCSGVLDRWDPFDPRARLSISLCGSGVKERGARSSLSRVDFQNLKETLFQKL